MLQSDKFIKATSLVLSFIGSTVKGNHTLYGAWQYSIDDFLRETDNVEGDENLLKKLTGAGIEYIFLVFEYFRKDRKRAESTSVKKVIFDNIKKQEDKEKLSYESLQLYMSSNKYLTLNDTFDRYKLVMDRIKSYGFNIGIRIINENTEIDNKELGHECIEYYDYYIEDNIKNITLESITESVRINFNEYDENIKNNICKTIINSINSFSKEREEKELTNESYEIIKDSIDVVKNIITEDIIFSDELAENIEDKIKKVINNRIDSYVNKVRSEFMKEYKQLLDNIVDISSTDFVMIANESTMTRIDNPMVSYMRDICIDLKRRGKKDNESDRIVTASFLSSDIAYGNNCLGDLIDIIGINYYPSVRTGAVPTIVETIQSISVSVLEEIRKYCSIYNKKFIISEYGCCPFEYQAFNPWKGYSEYLKTIENLKKQGLSEDEVMDKARKTRNENVRANYVKGGCLAFQLIKECCGLILWTLYDQDMYSWINSKERSIYENINWKDPEASELAYNAVKSVWENDNSYKIAEYYKNTAILSVNHNDKGNPHSQYIGNSNTSTISPNNYNYKKYYKLMSVTINREKDLSIPNFTFQAEFDVFENTVASTGKGNRWAISLKLGTENNRYFAFDNNISYRLMGKEGRAILTYDIKDENAIYYNLYISLIDNMYINVAKVFLKTTLPEENVTIYDRAYTIDEITDTGKDKMVFSRYLYNGIDYPWRHTEYANIPRYIEFIKFNLNIRGGYCGVWEVILDTGDAAYDPSVQSKNWFKYLKFLIYISNDLERYTINLKPIDSLNFNNDDLILCEEEDNKYILYCKIDYFTNITIKPAIENLTSPHYEFIECNNSYRYVLQNLDYFKNKRIIKLGESISN